MGWLILESVEGDLAESAFDGIEADARLFAPRMPSDASGLPGWVEEVFDASGYRFTVIKSDGEVLADSHADPRAMENHADRPEVVAALAGDVGRDKRISETTGFEQLYVALPVDAGVVLRLSIPARDVVAASAPIRDSIILISVTVGLVGVLVVAWLARRMTAPIAKLTAETQGMARGEPGHVLSRSPIREIDQLSVAIANLEEDNRVRLLEAERTSASLEVVLGALPQGTILFAEDDNVVYANPSAYALLGAVPDNLSGLTPFPFQTAVEESREARTPKSRIVEHGKPVRHLRAVATPFAEDDRILLVVIDVSDRERAASVRRDFVANASHELKTPVSAIIASSEALQIALERGDESSIRFAQQIERSARQLGRLVEDLLDLSRLERDEPELDPLGLELLVREELERIRPVADEREIAMTMNLTPVQVAGSRRDLSIAVRNLLDNAIRYTPPGGSIVAELSPVNGEIVLRITDTGEGIPTRDLERVFERFYRVDNARARATGGTGLGLAIVKHIVESHGGSVDVESELAAGSTFTVHLPVLAEDKAGAPLA
jgi:two-component system phosphate regulon sensor histidine kinase PhoR